MVQDTDLALINVSLFVKQTKFLKMEYAYARLVIIKSTWFVVFAAQILTTTILWIDAYLNVSKIKFMTPQFKNVYARMDFSLLTAFVRFVLKDSLTIKLF